MDPLERLHDYAGSDEERLHLPTFEEMLRRHRSARRARSSLGRDLGGVSIALAAMLVVAIVAVLRAAGLPADGTVGMPGTPTPELSASTLRGDPGSLRGLGRLALSVSDGLYVLDGSRGTLRRIAETGAMAWSKDGEWLAYTQLRTGSAELWLVRADGTGAQRLVAPGAAVSFMFKWSPTDDVLAFAPQSERGAAGLWVVTPGRPASVLAASDMVVSSFAWAADGHALAYAVTLPFVQLADRSDALYTVELAGGRSTQRTVAPRGGITGIAWWPDSKGVLFRRVPDHSASLLADGVPLETLPLEAGQPSGSFSEARLEFTDQWIDARRFVAVNGAGRWPTANKDLAICDIDTRSCQTVAALRGSVSLEPALSFDRSRIAFVRALDRGQAVGFTSDADAQNWMQTRALWVVDLRSGKAEEVTGAGRGILAPAWGRDGQHLLITRDRTAWLYDLGRNAGTEVARPLGMAGPFSGPGWSFAWSR